MEEAREAGDGSSRQKQGGKQDTATETQSGPTGKANRGIREMRKGKREGNCQHWEKLAWRGRGVRIGSSPS